MNVFFPDVCLKATALKWISFHSFRDKYGETLLLWLNEQDVFKEFWTIYNLIYFAENSANSRSRGTRWNILHLNLLAPFLMVVWDVYRLVGGAICSPVRLMTETNTWGKELFQKEAESFCNLSNSTLPETFNEAVNPWKWHSRWFVFTPRPPLGIHEHVAVQWYLIFVLYYPANIKILIETKWNACGSLDWQQRQTLLAPDKNFTWPPLQRGSQWFLWEGNVAFRPNMCRAMLTCSRLHG